MLGSIVSRPVCILISHFNQQLPVLYQCIMYFLKSFKITVVFSQQVPVLYQHKTRCSLFYLSNWYSYCKSSCLSVSKSDLTLGGGYFYICPNLTSGGGYLYICPNLTSSGGYHVPTQTDVTTLNSEQQLMLCLKIQGFYTFSWGGVLLCFSKIDLGIFFPVWIYIWITILI